MIVCEILYGPCVNCLYLSILIEINDVTLLISVILIGDGL